MMTFDIFVLIERQPTFVCFDESQMFVCSETITSCIERVVAGVLTHIQGLKMKMRTRIIEKDDDDDEEDDVLVVRYILREGEFYSASFHCFAVLVFLHLKQTTW